MHELIAIGCGILLGVVGLELTGPLYWRLLASEIVPAGPLTRCWLRLQRALLARTGHHPYLTSSLEALAGAPDAHARDAARARLRWWASIRGPARD
jgi:hypothetical protein